MTREEAINEIKSWAIPSVKGREVLETLIPELAESEDERIRKAIVGLIEELQRSDKHFAGVELTDMLAYLEKQKEQKPIPANSVGLKEQKPAEWSKNDTVFLNEITDFFENKTVRLQHDLDMYAHWLKSLPERFNLQPKQEWSEKEKKMLAVISYKISQHQGNDERSLFTPDEAEFICGMEDKFKSLRPSWKPSEEQMKALEDAFRKDGSDEYRKTINSLYQDLKKL